MGVVTSERAGDDLGAVVRHAIQRAVRTLAAIPDPDARYLASRSSWPEVVQDTRDAYGYTPPRVRTFRPTARDVSHMPMVLDWLAWVRRDCGERQVRLIMGWAMGVPWHRLAGQAGIGERQARRWLDDAVAAITISFLPEVYRVQYQGEAIEVRPAEAAPVTYDHHWQAPDARPRHRPEMHRRTVARPQLRQAATRKTA